MSRKKTILVLYYSRGVFPLRDTVHNLLYSWKKYSRHNIIYINIAFGFPTRIIKKLNIDVIIFHTLFLGMRWDLNIFKKNVLKCSMLKDMICTKIAMPQDEFIHTSTLNDFINDFGITYIMTCSSEPDWKIIYDKVDFKKVSFITVLTGYLDPGTIRRIKRLNDKVRKRDIDIGYRAWDAEYWLGEHGMHKVWVADIVKKEAQGLGYHTDISLKASDVLAGDKWFEFLLRCKTTIGVEGGASIIDKDGKIRERVNMYLSQHPYATFHGVKRECFPYEDNKLGLACISPRHLEACATETCQLLIEGKYNDILIPWKHYIPIKKDYSNIDGVLELIRDQNKCRTIAKEAYKDIVESKKWTYPAFIRHIEASLIDIIQIHDRHNKTKIEGILRTIINIKDIFNWVFIIWETKSVARKMAYKIYHFSRRSARSLKLIIFR